MKCRFCGFHLDLTQDVLRGRKMSVDAVDFNERVAHQARELDLAPRVVDGDDHHAVGVALIIARTGIQTEQCDIRDVFVRLNAGREILIGERGVVVIAEDSAVNVQSGRADHRQNDDNGQQTDENAPEAFERQRNRTQRRQGGRCKASHRVASHPCRNED